MINCKTCGSSIIEGANFCPNCGSKSIKERLTISGLFKNMFLTVSNLDISFYRTVKWLLINPSKVTLAYIQGVRKIITSPIQFALIVISIYGLFQFFFSGFIEMSIENSALSGFKDGLTDNSTKTAEDQIINNLVDWLHKHNQFVSFLIIPIFGFFSMIFYRAKKYNYAEHIVIALYAVSISVFLGVIFGLFMAPFKSDRVVDYYLMGLIFINIFSITWVMYKTMKGAIYKPFLLYILSSIVLYVGFFLLLSFLLILNDGWLNII